MAVNIAELMNSYTEGVSLSEKQQAIIEAAKEQEEAYTAYLEYGNDDNDLLLQYRMACSRTHVAVVALEAEEK